MFKEFRVSNFKSINQEQVFSLEACPQREISEYPHHVLNVGDQRILKISSFYGPNGGGKTTLLQGLIVMISVIFSGKIECKTFGGESPFPCAFSNEKFTTFELFTVDNEYEIGYSIKTDLSETAKDVQSEQSKYYVNPVIISEELMARKIGDNKFINYFSRNEDGVVSSDVLKGLDVIKHKTKLKPSTTFLNYYCNTFIDSKKDPVSIFYQELARVKVLNRETKTYIFDKYNVDSLTPYLKKASDILNAFDLKIKGLSFEPLNEDRFVLCISREINKDDVKKIQLVNESMGTRKLVNLILDILSIKESTVFLADDFDSHLHPKLIRAILDVMTSEENVNKQFIFNSHDIVNMNNEVFRRDEIWFAYRDDNYSTIYMPLSNIVDYKGNMVRKDAVYGKQYLEGKYGADPFVFKGLKWSL